MTQERRKFSDEFKEEAVRQALESGRPKKHIARDLDISESLLYHWISRYEEASTKGLSVEGLNDEKAEIARMKRELKQLREENEFLKKASAYFAKNQK